MKNTNKMKIAGLTAIIMVSLMLCAVPAFAIPTMPHRFYGAVTVAGLSAPDGTQVDAKIDGVTYATTYLLCPL